MVCYTVEAQNNDAEVSELRISYRAVGKIGRDPSRNLAKICRVVSSPLELSAPFDFKPSFDDANNFTRSLPFSPGRRVLSKVNPIDRAWPEVSVPSYPRQ
jgi:hypothetical protein